MMYLPKAELEMAEQDEVTRPVRYAASHSRQLVYQILETARVLIKNYQRKGAPNLAQYKH
jgi:hypothetical protein